ncbi:MAG: hypothetical protein KAS48_03195 [Gammaproteobacteria bacterium]|nr:hypothetical protein [Gammaproteobacteria bacterium]
MEAGARSQGWGRYDSREGIGRLRLEQAVENCIWNTIPWKESVDRVGTNPWMGEGRVMQEQLPNWRSNNRVAVYVYFVTGKAAASLSFRFKK